MRVGMPVDGPPRCTLNMHRRYFGEISEPEEFLHQRNARTRRRGEGARAVPAGADDDADGGQFVLGIARSRSAACRSPARCAGACNSVVKPSASEVEGVSGYQAQTVAPP